MFSVTTGDTSQHEDLLFLHRHRQRNGVLDESDDRRSTCAFGADQEVCEKAPKIVIFKQSLDVLNSKDCGGLFCLRAAEDILRGHLRITLGTYTNDVLGSFLFSLIFLFYSVFLTWSKCFQTHCPSLSHLWLCWRSRDSFPCRVNIFHFLVYFGGNGNAMCMQACCCVCCAQLHQLTRLISSGFFPSFFETMVNVCHLPALCSNAPLCTWTSRGIMVKCSVITQSSSAWNPMHC